MVVEERRRITKVDKGTYNQKESLCSPWWGTLIGPHMKGARMVVGNFELNP